METTVPMLSVVFICISMLAGLAIPAVMFLVLRKKYGCDRLPFFIGCAVMLVFAFVLESLAHSLILGSTIGAAITGNIWLYGLYGGFMAGLFEETGRFIAFKTVLKKSLHNDHNALMYGAGHGGFEAFYLLVPAMAVNLSYVLAINSGNAAGLTAGLSGDALASVQTVITQLTAYPSWMFFVGVLERIAAVVVHLSLSVLVWFAAKDGKKSFWLYLLAILLHLLLDAGVLIINSYLNNPLLLEVIVYVIAALFVLIAVRVWKNHTKPAEQATAPAEAQ